MTKKWKGEKKDVYNMVNDKVLAMMEQGKLNWTKNWKGSSEWNYNLHTGTRYSILNNFMLELDKVRYGYSSNSWLTFKGVQALGGNIAGQKSTSFIVFFKLIDKRERDESGNEKIIGRIPLVKYTPLFNLE